MTAAAGNGARAAAESAAVRLDASTQAVVLAEARHWGLPLRFDRDRPVLDYPAERLDAARIAKLAGPGLPPAEILPFCDSTNTRILEQAELQLCLSEAQWAGRGRRGRSWYSPFGRHLYLSLRLSTPAEPPASLPLVAALSAYQVLAAQLPGLWVKWPNDLWLDGRKLGGFLAEGRRRGGQQDWVLGMGLNCHLDPGLDASGTCLAEHGQRVDRNALAAAILRQWQADFPLLASAGFTAFAERWAAADRLCGQTVEVQRDGQCGLGQARGVDHAGRLRVQIAGEERYLDAADVRIRPAP
ncbi:MAG: biotin--[acetyl-CoA-carboxylase] ligase [Acidithiobacillus sp.]|uniref:biotin--[acetyl-CoA-carboxylase] ligase n=1 Tax=Acidithiobacillus sp. TaxID=1872118 RepID=UPI003CFD0C3C